MLSAVGNNNFVKNLVADLVKRPKWYHHSIEHFDTTDFQTKFAGLVKNFDPRRTWHQQKDARKMDLFIQ